MKFAANTNKFRVVRFHPKQAVHTPYHTHTPARHRARVVYMDACLLCRAGDERQAVGELESLLLGRRCLLADAGS